MKLTQEQYVRMVNKSITYKESKYKAQKKVVNGIKFDSKKEANRYIQLKQMEKLGIIKDLKRQVIYELQPSFKFENKTIRAIKYIADFVYTIVETGEEIIEDTKGYRTEIYRLKKKMFVYTYKKQIKEI